MRRLASDQRSLFDLKNGVGYKGVVGYNLYDGAVYDIQMNTYLDTLDGRWRSPRFSASSTEIVFEWWDIEKAEDVPIVTGAAGLAAGVAAFWIVLS